MINILLFPEPESELPLAALVAGAAVGAGAKEKDLPNYGEIAKHVASVVGSSEFGKLRAPNGHSQQLQPLELVHRLWPLTRDILRQPPPKRFIGPREKPLQEIHWPIIISNVAFQFISMTKDDFNPSISAMLVMESAIITSKIDPELIEPGKWHIDSSETSEPVTRLRN